MMCVCLQDKEEADYVEWLKGQVELEGPEEVTDMVSVKSTRLLSYIQARKFVHCRPQ